MTDLKAPLLYVMVFYGCICMLPFDYALKTVQFGKLDCLLFNECLSLYLKNSSYLFLNNKFKKRKFILGQ